MNRPSPNVTPPNEPDYLLTLRELVALTSLSRATIYRQVADGDFPAPIKIGRTSRWISSEVSQFIETRRRTRAGARSEA